MANCPSLSHFRFASFQFNLKASESLTLPGYKGSTFRGAFGYAFKKVVCVSREKACYSCLLKGKCVYSYVFETPPPPDTTRMRKYPFAPHPFVIVPPLEKKTEYQEGESICFELTLIGKAIDYLPYFIYTFDELGKIGIGKGKGKYHLQEVKGEGYENIGERTKVKGERVEDQYEEFEAKDEDAILIYSGKEKVLHSDLPVLRIDDLTFQLQNDPSPLTLALQFITPTRLKFDQSLSPTLEFHILIRNLLRRISLLSYFHCGEELAVDFKGLIEEAKGVKIREKDLRWFDWERYSNRQEERMKMGGLIGSITFEGNFTAFMPFLLLGEHIHVGKGTSFGLGKYQIMRN